jgi:hypothetical protein
MKTKLLVTATILIVISYVLSALFGYDLLLDNPNGMMLYTPPAEPIDHTMYGQPAFPIGMFIGLFMFMVLYGVLGVVSIVLSLFVSTESAKLSATNWAKIFGLAFLPCSVGALVIAL